ncbi:MAG TPA: hypothetical protein VMF14_02385 [Solirubrobacteraceae bacterium]|nr:hypothetical protein [Solirubrobacteraceae bacterium]
MRRLIPAVTALICVLALAACGGSSSSSSTGSAATGTSSAAGTGTSGSTGTTSASSSASQEPAIGFEGVPLQTGPPLAPASTTGTGKVDGISCGAIEQLAYHIHAHLAVFKNGQAYTLPAGVGIPGSQAAQTQEGPIAAGGHCYYWLHTHTTDGVIHIESPTKAIYTLGNFFDEWHQPLTGSKIASLSGKVTAFVNGKPWKKSPRDIPLLPHEDIQLEIGEPTPPLVTIDWSKTQL